MKKPNLLIRFSLYKQDSLFYLGIKSNPVIDYKDYTTWLKRDADTILIIRKNVFNELAKKTINLSSSQILKGMNPSNPSFGMDGIGVNLELVIMNDIISYNIDTPNYKTVERNLEQFLSICKEILLLAKLNPKEIF